MVIKKIGWQSLPFHLIYSTISLNFNYNYLIELNIMKFEAWYDSSLTLNWNPTKMPTVKYPWTPSNQIQRNIVDRNQHGNVLRRVRRGMSTHSQEQGRSQERINDVDPQWWRRVPLSTPKVRLNSHPSTGSGGGTSGRAMAFCLGRPGSNPRSDFWLFFSSEFLSTYSQWVWGFF